MSQYVLKLGADPEMFLKKGRSYVSAEGVIPGTKDSPHPVKMGAVQVDGMAVEFNIEPATNADEFSDNIQIVMDQLDEMVGDHELICKPSVEFTKKVWNSASEVAKELGCEPDFNAWTGKVNPKPDAGAKFRTAAGHIHIGWTEGADPNSKHHINECEAIVKELDYRLGFPSIFVDNDTRRRELYGKAGAYRAKPYGVEYRVLSNFWIQTPELRRWVFNTVEETLQSLYNRQYPIHSDIYGGGEYDPRNIIDNNNKDSAKVFINAFNDMRIPE